MTEQINEKLLEVALGKMLHTISTTELEYMNTRILPKVILVLGMLCLIWVGHPIMKNYKIVTKSFYQINQSINLSIIKLNTSEWDLHHFYLKQKKARGLWACSTDLEHLL